MINLNRQNYFQRFDLEESLNIDLDMLEEKYLSLQSKFHPDKLIDKNKEDRVNLEMNSILFNEAYEVLRRPIARAIYFLKLKAGIDINDDSSCKVKPDENTLIENLELRELIFETDSKEVLKELRDDCKKKILLILDIVKKEFEKKDYDKCAIELIKARYLDKTIFEIKRKIIK